MAARKTLTLTNEALGSSAAPAAIAVSRTARKGGIRAAAASVLDYFRSARTYYQAATRSPKIRFPMDAGPNSHNGEISIIRARSRYAKANHAFYKQAIRQIANNVVGHGIRPVISNPELKSVWDKWANEADARGHFSFYGLQWHAVDALATDGEVLFRMRSRKDGDTASGVPLQLQIMEADHLPFGWTRQEPNGNFTLDGVERDAIERVSRYHLYPRHPSDWRGTGASLMPIPIDASEICHMFLPERPTSERGVPWGASVLNNLEFFQEYQLGEVAKKSIQSKITTFYSKPLNEEGGFSGSDDTEMAFVNPEIGSAVEVPEGYDVRFAQMPTTDGNFEPFNRSVLSEVAVALGLCFELITLDFSKMTDRSYRAMMIQVGKFIDSVVYHLVVQCFGKVWRRFLSAAVLAGAWTVPEGMKIEDFMYPEWMPPPRGHVHPVQEIEALIAAVKAGIFSRTQATAEMGLNTFEIDLQNAEEFKRSSELGLFYSVFEGYAEKAAAAQAARMANDNKYTDVTVPALSLKEFLEQYAQAVRAGTITPQPEDEATVRSMFGLPGMSSDVSAFWETQKGVRQPITLTQPAKPGGFGGFGEPTNDAVAQSDAISVGAE